MRTRALNQFTTQPFAPTSWERTEDGFLRVKARVLAERVMPYERHEINGLPDDLIDDMVNVGVSLDEICLADALHTLEGAQVVAPDHVWVTPENYTVSKGNTAGAASVVGPYLCIDLMITDPETIRAIEAREIGEISAGYHADCVFGADTIGGAECHAKQVGLRFNHIAIIPWTTGRAGEDVRILNAATKIRQQGGFSIVKLPNGKYGIYSGANLIKECDSLEEANTFFDVKVNNSKSTLNEGDKVMEGKVVRIRLKNSGRFVNTDEEGAAALAVEEGAVAEGGETQAKSLEQAMQELESKTGEMETIQAELEELKGELSVYKEKLDELLSTEAVEHAAEEVVTEQGEAETILENALPEEMQEKKEEIKNSIKGLRRNALHVAVLNSIGCKTDGMSPEGIKGAFKAQVQMCSMRTTNRKVVVGAHIVNSVDIPETRTAHQKLGFK